MTEEKKPSLKIAADSVDVPDPTVSLTFTDPSDKPVLKIISAVTPEDRARIEADQSGQLLIQYIIAHVAHELKKFQGIV